MNQNQKIALQCFGFTHADADSYPSGHTIPLPPETGEEIMDAIQSKDNLRPSPASLMMGQVSISHLNIHPVSMQMQKIAKETRTLFGFTVQEEMSTPVGPLFWPLSHGASIHQWSDVKDSLQGTAPFNRAMHLWRQRHRTAWQTCGDPHKIVIHPMPGSIDAAWMFPVHENDVSFYSASSRRTLSIHPNQYKNEYLSATVHAYTPHYPDYDAGQTLLLPDDTDISVLKDHASALQIITEMLPEGSQVTSFRIMHVQQVTRTRLFRKTIVSSLPSYSGPLVWVQTPEGKTENIHDPAILTQRMRREYVSRGFILDDTTQHRVIIIPHHKRADIASVHLVGPQDVILQKE